MCGSYASSSAGREGDSASSALYPPSSEAGPPRSGFCSSDDGETKEEAEQSNVATQAREGDRQEGTRQTRRSISLPLLLIFLAPTLPPLLRALFLWLRGLLGGG